MSKKNKNKDVAGGLFFVGCLFIGLGLGMLFGNVAIGVMFGLGCGFITQGFMYIYRKKK